MVRRSSSNHQRVLVVDDQPGVCDSIRKVLLFDQYEVEAFTNGSEALVAFQRGKFDLVILDYQMPGMTGDELAAKVRTLAPHQRILMITAYGESLAQGGERQVVADSVMSKPFDVEEFRVAVHQLTARR